MKKALLVQIVPGADIVPSRAPECARHQGAHQRQVKLTAEAQAPAN